MAQKIKLDDAEYEVENLSEQAKAYIATLKFTDTRLQELTNMRALLQRALGRAARQGARLAGATITPA